MANQMAALRNLTQYRLGFKIAIAAATIGVIYGYDLGNISGALLFITKEFDLTTKETEWVATIVVAGSIAGALAASRLANAIGRKPTMVLVAVTYAVFAILGGLAQSLVWLDVSRFFLGVTIGLSVVTAPIFVAESSPAAVRGGLIVMYQVATVTGIVIAYFVDYALAGSGSWRIMLALSAVPSLAVLAVLARLPDTPRWYLMKGRREEARDTLALTDPDADTERELDEIETELRRERGGSVAEMLRAPYRRATLFVLGLGFLIQITGINAVVFYSPLIFKEMGFSGNAALLLLPAIVQVGSLIATVVSLSVVDRLGRRPTLLSGIGAMVASTLLLTAVFAAGGLTGTTGWLGFVGIFVFTAGFNFGFGSLVWVYASESFPARLRTMGASAMLTADLVANLIIGLYFLTALESLGGTATFAMFATLAVVSFAFVSWLAPETKGRPLEAIRAYWENGGRWPAEGERPGEPRFTRAGERAQARNDPRTPSAGPATAPDSSSERMSSSP
jgi:SP family arabinose:H+ symporter-like MFS transporter